MLDIVGIELRTTELTGALDVRGTSAKRGPKRSVDRIPDVSLFNEHCFFDVKKSITPK